MTKAYRLSPFGHCPFGHKLPSRIKDLYPFIARIGDINFVGRRIDCDRRWIVKFASTIALAAPTRQHLTIGVELNDARAALVDDID